VKRVLTAALLTLFVLPSFAQQTTPPAPAAPREAKIPQPVERTLDNGLRVIVVPKHDIPLVAARLLFRAGSAADPKSREGLASLTATVLTKGTKTRSAEEIARGVEALGATLSSDAGYDSSVLDLSVMSVNFAKAMAFLADAARNPTFKQDELDRERQQVLDELQLTLREPRPLASIVMARLLYGDAPYGHNVSGLPSSLEKIARADLARFHASWYRPNNAVLVIGGDVQADAAFALAQSLFGSWPRGTLPAVTAKATKTPAQRVVVVDLPDAGQAAVLIGRPGIRRADPAYLQAMVANSIVGGGYSSRLNQEIRIKRGLSYGAGSSFSPRVDAGPFTASTQTKNESAAEVAGIIVGELGKLSTAAVSDAELTPRKAVLIGGFAQSLERSAGLVDEISDLALYGMPLSDINRYIAGVQAVTAADVQKVAGTSMTGKDATIVVVGNAKAFIEPLRAQYKDVEVIGIDELDVASPTLRVRKAKR
jgi:zinc protease